MMSKGSYEILYQDAYPIIKYRLKQGETIKAESDAMITMTSAIDVEGSMEGGVLKGLTRMLAGESFFFQKLTAKRGDGEVILGHASPGGIIDIELDGSYKLKVQKDGFLAATEGVTVDTKMQNLVQGMFSGEGFFTLSVGGVGTVFLSSYGAIHAINLDDGEEITVDNGHLVAWTDYMHYKIDKASGGWLSSFASGEMLVCKFKGPGIVLIQTRNPKSFKNWLQKLGLASTSQNR